MSKANLFVVAYSFVLIGLFCTFCYLMTTVNPEPLKQDKIRRFGSDDYIYPNDALRPNDNLAFGLEKVTDDYDTIDVDDKVQPSRLSKVKKVSSEIPSRTTHTKKYDTTVTLNKKQKSQATRKLNSDDNKIINKPIKIPLRGFRRSINKNEQLVYVNTPQSLVIKVKYVDGKPRVEMKVVTKIMTNDIRPSLNKADFELDDENNAVLKLDGNETLIVNVVNEYDNDSILKENKDKKLIKHTNELENVYTINLLDKNMNERYQTTKQINKTSQITTKFTNRTRNS